MAIKTSQAINGFISADPRLTFSESGQARFYAESLATGATARDRRLTFIR